MKLQDCVIILTESDAVSYTHLSRTVPPAIRAFLESDDYESAVRLAISLGGDSDALACIAGGIAHAYYGSIPAPIASLGMLLDSGLRRILRDFSRRFGVVW